MIAGDIKTAAVIGAGVSGLAAAKCLRQIGVKCEIFDRSPKLGGVWAAGYHGYGVQVQKDLYEFPDFPLPPGVSDFTAGPVFQEYLEDYCSHFGLRDSLRLSSRVIAVRRSGQGWILDVERNGETVQLQADLVVAATGLYSETPNIPVVDGQEQFAGEIWHSSEMADAEMLRGRRVAVVGYGKSATDIAGAAAEVADEVHLVFRTAHWPVPRRLLGLLPFKWGMLTRLVAAMIPPYVHASPAVRALHSAGYPLPWLFWRIVELLLRTQQGLGTEISNGKTLVPDHPVEIDAFSEVTMVPRPGFIDLIRRKEILAHRSAIEGFNETGLVLEEGGALPVDSVVFGTGWKPGHGYLPEDTRKALEEEADGFYLYRHILHPNVPNLAFIGWSSSFMSVTTFALQARWLAEAVAGRVVLPSQGEMRQEISRLRAWKQSWMPEGRARSATLLLHMAHYHDELLEDMKADPLRKTGLLAPLKEILVPYQASDFRDVA